MRHEDNSIKDAIIDELRSWDRRFDSAETIADAILEIITADDPLKETAMLRGAINTAMAQEPK